MNSHEKTACGNTKCRKKLKILQREKTVVLWHGFLLALLTAILRNAKVQFTTI